MKTMAIGDKEYAVRYTTNTLCKMEQDGINVMDMGQLLDNISFTLIRKLFYYGLKDSAGKAFNEVKAGDMMDEFIEENTYDKLIEIFLGELTTALGYNLDEVVEVEDTK